MRRAVAIASTLLLTACAHSVKEIARESSSAAVDESVSQLTDEDAKKQALEAAQDPRVEAALREMTDHVTEGILKSLESERAREQVAVLTTTATRAAVQQLVASLSAPQTRAQLELLTTNMTQSVLENLGQALNNRFVPSLQQALAPAAPNAPADQQGPLHAALGNAAQNFGYHVVLGANAGLRSSWRDQTGALGQLQQASERGTPWLSLLLGALALTALIVVGAAVVVVARTRRARLEVLRLESATLLLATAMRERHASQDTDELVTVVRDALEKSAQEHRHHGLLAALRLRGHSH
jgi:hypothetical protein